MAAIDLITINELDNNSAQISDEMLLEAVSVYMQISGSTRLQFILELRELAHQDAILRFNNLFHDRDIQHLIFPTGD